MAKNRTCLICGEKYDYCPHCDRDRLKPMWYFVFCSKKCYELDDILSQNTAGNLSLAEANKKLKNVVFNKEDILNKDTKAHIEKIMAYKEKEGLKEKPEIKK